MMRSDRAQICRLSHLLPALGSLSPTPLRLARELLLSIIITATSGERPAGLFNISGSVVCRSGFYLARARPLPLLPLAEERSGYARRKRLNLAPIPRQSPLGGSRPRVTPTLIISHGIQTNRRLRLPRLPPPASPRIHGGVTRHQFSERDLEGSPGCQQPSA